VVVIDHRLSDEALDHVNKRVPVRKVDPSRGLIDRLRFR
jgi:hypothetical protein